MEQIPVPAVDIAAIVRALAPLTPSGVVDDVVERVAARVHGLGPVEPLLADPSVSEVMINGPGPVWVERGGVVSRSEVVLDRAAVDLVIERIVSPLGRRVDQLTPCVDGRLPDGSRVHVAVPPVAVDGPYVTIRRFVVPDVTLDVFAGPPVVALLEELVDRGANVVVSGGTGSGQDHAAQRPGRPGQPAASGDNPSRTPRSCSSSTPTWCAWRPGPSPARAEGQ